MRPEMLRAEPSSMIVKHTSYRKPRHEVMEEVKGKMDQIEPNDKIEEFYEMSCILLEKFGPFKAGESVIITNLKKN